MTAEVKQVTSVVKESVDAIKKRAQETADKLKTRTKETTQALDMVDQYSDALDGANAELRGLLGTQTNNPPLDDEKKVGLFGKK